MRSKINIPPAYGPEVLEAVSIKLFGAIGDGVTDDELALERAIAAASADGYELYWPKGDYKSTTTPANFSTVQHVGPGVLVVGSSRSPIGREKLQANRTYYVATTGADSNDGLTSGNPFLTWQAAIDTVTQLDIGTYDVTIDISNGTYTDGLVVNGPWLGSGTVTITGDTTTPSNVLLSTTSENAIEVKNGGRLSVEGIEMRTTTSGHCIDANAAVVFTSGKVQFGACAGIHIRAINYGVVDTQLQDYTVSGGASRHWHAVNSGLIVASAGTLTVSSTPNFSAAFARAVRNSTVLANAKTFSGSATGKRYDVQSASLIDTGGQSSTFFPGDSAGTDDATVSAHYT